MSLEIYAEPTLNRQAERFIPVAFPMIGIEEEEEVVKVIRSRMVSGGETVTRFEQQWAALVGQPHAVACNSGASALVLALRAAGVRRGDRVLIPTMTMVAVANAVLTCHAIPVFADSSEGDGNPAIDNVLLSGVKFAIAPHLYGVPCERFIDDCNMRGIVVIEDCAEAHCAKFSDGSPVGSRGVAGIWSFYGNKIATTGEGGIVATHNASIANRARDYGSHYFTKGYHFLHQDHAYGMRMNALTAAFGIGQLSKIDLMLKRRAEIADAYIARLARVHGVNFLQRTSGSAWWVFPILLRDQLTKVAARKHLADHGVETRTFFYPMHCQPFLKEYSSGNYPVSERLYRRGMYLPLHTEMTVDDVDYICKLICEVIHGA